LLGESAWKEKPVAPELTAPNPPPDDPPPKLKPPYDDFPKLKPPEAGGDFRPNDGFGRLESVSFSQGKVFGSEGVPASR